MPRHPSPLPPSLGHTFRTKTAREAGATQGRLRARDLETPFRGVRQRIEASPAAPDAAPFARDRAQRDAVMRLATAYATLMGPHAFFAGRTALALRALPVSHGPDLEVGVFSPARAPRRRGIRGRRLEPSLVHVESVAGLPTATAASAWAMLAGELRVRELIVLGDAIIHIPRDRYGLRRPERAIATLDQLARAAAAGPRHGAAKLREALAAIRTESASPLETEFRLDAAASGLPVPQLDREIRDARGRLLGVSEFAYPEWMLVVEVEGDHHRSDVAQWNRDLEKYAAYAEAGWEVVRVTGRHVRRRTATALVERALLRRGWRAGHFGRESTPNSRAK